MIRHQYQVSKQVNGGHWLYISSHDTEEEASEVAEDRLRFHMERCPKDAVEFRVSTPWSDKRIYNGNVIKS